MKISPMEAALIHADRRVNIKQIGVSATLSDRIKICCDSRAENLQRQHFGCAESMEWSSKTLFCYLPLGVPKDICTCQLHVILSPQTPWSVFRAHSSVTSHTHFWAALKCKFVPQYFPKSASMLLLRALLKSVQSVLTVKFVLDPSVYKVIMQGSQ